MAPPNQTATKLVLCGGIDGLTVPTFPPFPPILTTLIGEKIFFIRQLAETFIFPYRRLQNQWECGNETLKALVQHGLWRYHFVPTGNCEWDRGNMEVKMTIKDQHPEWFPKCDYLECVNRYRQDEFIQCRDGHCAHYGNCLPVDGFRETPERAVGEHTREKGGIICRQKMRNIQNFLLTNLPNYATITTVDSVMPNAISGKLNTIDLRPPIK